jgi:hypothetical protein
LEQKETEKTIRTFANASLSRIGYVFSSVWQHVIPFKIFDRLGKIRGAPRDAIVADISIDESRSRHLLDSFSVI